MAIDVKHTEMIDGVKIEYLSWGNHRISCGTGLNAKSKTLKEILQPYGEICAKAARKGGFKRVQIGSHGDYYFNGITKGRLVSLDTMFVARFLKR